MANNEETGSAASTPREQRTLRTTDPTRMRALAHPLRVEILELLGRHDELTASEVAEQLDQTVANASFHLRTLEKHGYVERCDQRGREKPWRAVHTTLNHTPDPNDLESVAQAGSLATIYVEREAARLVNTLRRLPDNALPEWILATTITNSEFWATSEEMTELAQSIIKLTDRFNGRTHDPSQRPAGARRGFLFGTVNPDPDCPPWDPEADSQHPDGSGHPSTDS